MMYEERLKNYDSLEKTVMVFTLEREFLFLTLSSIIIFDVLFITRVGLYIDTFTWALS